MDHLHRRSSAISPQIRALKTKYCRLNSLGPLMETLSSPVPAPFVYTLKSAVSFTLRPFGCRPRPVALHRLGLHAADTRGRALKRFQTLERRSHASFGGEEWDEAWSQRWKSETKQSTTSTQNKAWKTLTLCKLLPHTIRRLLCLSHPTESNYRPHREGNEQLSSGGKWSIPLIS